MAYLSKLRANHILLKAPKGSPSISGIERAFQWGEECLEAKWNVYVIKITFLAKSAQMVRRKGAPCMSVRECTVVSGGGGAVLEIMTSYGCGCEPVFPGMTTGEFGQSGQHLCLKWFQFIEVRLAQVPVLINITWSRETHPLRFWECHPKVMTV